MEEIPSRRQSTAGSQRRKSSVQKEPTNWAQGLRGGGSQGGPRKRSSVIEIPDNLALTQQISEKLKGQNTYQRAKVLADEIERLHADMLKPADGDKLQERQPVPEVNIPANPNITSTLSLEAQCVRALEYEDEIEILLREGKLEVTDTDLVKRWEARQDFTQAANEQTKRELLEVEFRFITQILNMFRAELERLSR